jgi:GNAT superfamily N-acetyltransferase
MPGFRIRVLRTEDGSWVRTLLTQRWYSPRIVTRGRVHQADQLPGFIAEDASGLLGLTTYRLEAGQCEVVTLDSLAGRRGIGTALLAAVQAAARAAGCRRLWLITTNDNLQALRFYQRRGLVLAALHRDALRESRKLKPEIGAIGADGIPLRDEIELELRL